MEKVRIVIETFRHYDTIKIRWERRKGAETYWFLLASV